MEKPTILKDLKTNGYAIIDFPTGDLIKPVMDGYKRFLELSDDEKLRWNIPVDGTNWQTGYLLREESINSMTGYAFDFKDVFHFQPGLFDRLSERGVDTRQHRDWLASLDKLYNVIFQEAKDIARAIQDEYPGAVKVVGESKMFQGGHTLRLLNYHMKEREGGLIGAGHIDESFLTFRVFENIPGLRGRLTEGEQILTAESNQAVIYPGKKAGSISGGEIQPLYHDVIDTRDDKKSDVHRMSIVFFLDIIQ